MLHYIVGKDFDSILMQIIIVFLSWVLVVFSAMLGLRAIVARGGEGKKFSKLAMETFNKVVEYLCFMFFMLFIDVLNPIFSYFDIITLPLFTLGGAMFLIYTEWKSVRKNSSDSFKENLENNPSEMIEFVRDNADVIKELLGKINKK